MPQSSAHFCFSSMSTWMDHGLFRALVMLHGKWIHLEHQAGDRAPEPPEVAPGTCTGRWVVREDMGMWDKANRRHTQNLGLLLFLSEHSEELSERLTVIIFSITS